MMSVVVESDTWRLPRMARSYADESFEPEAEPFGQFVRRHRKSLGLTQDELAEKAGISQSYVSGLERGINLEPDREVVLSLARVFNVSSRLALRRANITEFNGSEDVVYVTDPEIAEVVELYEGLSSPANKSVARDMLRSLREAERKYSIGGGMEPTVEPPERDTSTGTK